MIAEKLDIVVQPKSDAIDGVSGMLLRHGNNFGIMYATRYGNEGFERFSVAHEIAHFLLEGHIDHVLKNGEHYSHAGFTSSDPYEMEADSFAAGLLMPEDLFKAALKKRDTDLATIEYMASLCKTSITATAIRCSEMAKDAVAIAISTGPAVDYCRLSEAMKTLPKLNWIKKGTAVPASTETAKLNADPLRVRAGDRAVSEIDVREWLGGTRSARITEEVVGLGRYGKTLTVLSSSSIGDEEARYDDDDNEQLQESWTPHFSEVKLIRREDPAVAAVALRTARSAHPTERKVSSTSDTDMLLPEILSVHETDSRLRHAVADRTKVSGLSLPKRECRRNRRRLSPVRALGSANRDDELESDGGNRMLSPIRERRPNLFSLKLVSNSKRSYFENRIEWAECRGSERNARFGE